MTVVAWLLVAVVVALAVAVAAGVRRVWAAVGDLRAGVAEQAERLRAVADELSEAGQVTGLELADLQSSVSDLTGSWGSSDRAGRHDHGGYTAPHSDVPA